MFAYLNEVYFNESLFNNFDIPDGIIVRIGYPVPSADISVQRGIVASANIGYPLPDINLNVLKDIKINANIEYSLPDINVRAFSPIFINGSINYNLPDTNVLSNATNFRFVDFTKQELIVSGSGANKFLTTQVDQDLNLGGFPSATRIENFSIIRKNPIESLNIKYISGTNGEGNLTVQMVVDETSSSYKIQYMAPDSSSYGPAVDVEYNKEIKLYDTDVNKYIFIELYEATVINRIETVQLRKNYNNVISMDNFDKNNPTPQYRAIYFRNSYTDPVENLTLWTDTNDSILTEFGAELPVDKEISIIADGTSEPATIDTWLSFTDSSSATPIIGELRPGGFIGVWLKNSLINDTSSEVSAKEGITVNYKFHSLYDDMDVSGSLHGYTRIYDIGLEDKTKIYYNINDTIDSTSVESVIVDTTSLPHKFLETSLLIDNDLIYYDAVNINRFGLESVKDTSKYVLYTAGNVSEPPLPPSLGNILYNSTGEMLVQANYFPDSEVDINNRAYFWNVNINIADTSSPILSDYDVDMDQTSGSSTYLETLNYIVDSSSLDLLDNTPLNISVYTKNNSGRSLTSYDLSGNIIKQIANISPKNVHQFYGEHYGIDKYNNIPFNNTIIISDTSGNEINYINNDGSVELNRNGEIIFKVYYRGETDIFNKFYLRDDYTIDTSSSFDTSSTVTENTIVYEVEDINTMYFLVNLKRKMQIDFNSKTISIAGNFTDSTSLEEIYSDISIFPRYTQTVFNIFDVRDQILKPYGILDDDGNFNIFMELNNEYTYQEIGLIL
jgi:hypothetical protein